MKIKTKCDWCGKVIYKFKYSIKKNKHNYCNAKCMGKWRSKFWRGENNNSWNGGKIKVKCEWCGKILYRLFSHIKKHIFCCSKCHTDSLRKKRIRSKCNYCKKIFYRLETSIVGKKHIFCSAKCHRNWKKDRIKVVKCDYCKTKINRTISSMKFNKHYFCNKTCRTKYFMNLRYKVKCYYCNKIILKSKFRFFNQKIFFCNKKCLKKYYDKYGKSEYSSEFNNKLKEFVRKRDGYRCQCCGVHQKECGKALDIHHIDYNKNNNDPINLIALCSSCHIKTNGNRKYFQNHFEEYQIERKVHLLNMKLEMEEKLW